MKNLCNYCKVLEVTTCPIFERAYKKGYEGMAKCEVKDMLYKILNRYKELGLLIDTDPLKYKRGNKND